MKNISYFDHAATSWPKPYEVTRAVKEAMEKRGGNPGRSSHSLSLLAAQAIFECREKICELLNFDYPERVIFSSNATGALNIAIHGLVPENSHIVISNLEHNSVLRPVYAMTRNPNANITYSVFSALSSDEEKVYNEFKSSVRKNTKTVVVTAASNICGKILPIAKIGKYCREHSITLIVDASQACGVIPLDMKTLNIDVLCSAGHKGLLGPQGTGFAIFGENVEPTPMIQGGNGINSYDPEMNGMLPERLEAGTLNTPGICGLCEGIKEVLRMGVVDHYEECSFLAKYFTLGLMETGKAKIYGDYQVKTPVVLFNFNGMAPDEVSRFLDSKKICTRSGLHCAPLAHKALGTDIDGAVRASFGYGNTKRQIDSFLFEIRNIGL